MKNCAPLWRAARLEVKKLKAPHVRRPFGSSYVEKAQGIVERSTFRSENAQSTSAPEHFWKLGC